MKRTAALIVVLVAAYLAVAITAAPTSAFPLQQVWYRRLDSGLGIPRVNPLGQKVVTFIADRVVDEASVLVALDVDDGTLLWNSTGIRSNTFTAPFVRVGQLENGLLVADFVEDSSASNTTWEGFVVLVTKALRPSNSRKQWSGTQQLSRWNQLYVVRWGDQNSLLRLQAAIYSPYSPAATYNWTSPLFGDRDPGLYAAQRRGILLHATYEPNSVRRLEPSTLKPMWGIPEVGSYDQVYISTFIEDIFLVVSTAPSAPFINVVTAFSLEFGTALWKWTTTSQVASAFIYSGTAVDRKTGNQRLCGRLVQLASKTPEERLLCIEPWSARVTLNVTLRCSSDLAYPKAEFMAIYDTWALVKDTASGNLLALSCFNPTEASLATPSWVFPNQRDLSSVTVSEDGLSYLIASYKPYVNNAFRSAIARWDRNATLGL